MKSDDFKKSAIHQPLTEDSFSKPKIILSRQKSLELWLKGKDEWNSWMKDNPKNSVDFRGVHFDQSGIEKLVPCSKYDFAGKCQKSLETISFEGYIFNGLTDFAGATFPLPTFFDGAIFKETACFSGVIFEKEANFQNTTFKSFAIFTDAHFKGPISFSCAIFKSTTNFISTTFNLMAYFPSSIFEDAVSFSHANFDGSTHFLGATFNCTVIDFEEIESSDTFYFENAIALQALTLSFKGSSFEKDFIIDGNFNCIPDLRGTKLNHHTELSSLNYKLKRVWVNPFTPIRKAAFKADAEKLCRLKELAEQNKNHDKALMFYADEMRAKRWTKLNTAQSILDLLYSATSVV